MTKSELRKARKAAVAAGRHYTQIDAVLDAASTDAGYDKLPGATEDRRTSEAAAAKRAFNFRATAKPITRKRASKAEQQAHYLDCGPANWDDR